MHDFGLYSVSTGIRIDMGGTIISGVGVPGGDSGIQDAASLGSIFMRVDEDCCQIYIKNTDTNSPADWFPNASKNYVDLLIANLPWRNPARLLDSTSTSVADAKTSADATDEIDGVTITDGDRILFTAFTTDNNNVYIVSGSSGNWTFTEDEKEAEAGDAIIITEGTSATQQWVYGGVFWGQLGGAGEDEFARTIALLGL